jgi:23S rRNA (adenine2503-C2)-methyltransferase
MVTPPPSGNPGSTHVLDLDLPALTAVMQDRFGEPAYRARQIVHAVYQRGARDFDAMTELPAALRARLPEWLDLTLPTIHEVKRSEDGSRKYLLDLADGRRIESVFLVDGERVTFCLSSQVGCAFGCDFCLTARMGLVRQLSPAEILGQVLLLADEGGLGREGYNLVFMGMGEPLHNFDALAGTLDRLMAPEGMGLSYRRITVSTVGDVAGIRRLGQLERRPRLAVSVNAAEDTLRSRMMPVNRAHPLAELMATLRAYPLRRGERITLEYVLLAGVNDAPEHADGLARLTRGLACKVNLIPFNAAEGLDYAPPEPHRLERFHARLVAAEVPCTVRWSRGRDIRAACGQLAVEEA